MLDLGYHVIQQNDLEYLKDLLEGAKTLSRKMASQLVTYSVMYDRVDCLRLILEHPSFGESIVWCTDALRLACQARRVGCVSQLLFHGAELSLPAFEAALAVGAWDLAHMVLEEGSHDPGQRRVLMAAKALSLRCLVDDARGFRKDPQIIPLQLEALVSALRAGRYFDAEMLVVEQRLTLETSWLALAQATRAAFAGKADASVRDAMLGLLRSHFDERDMVGALRSYPRPLCPIFGREPAEKWAAEEASLVSALETAINNVQ
jgi:hypothetical protein